MCCVMPLVSRAVFVSYRLQVCGISVLSGFFWDTIHHIMVVTGYLRVLASSAVLLLTITATALVRPAGGSSSSGTVAFFEHCAPLYFECSLYEDCAQCAGITETSSSGVDVFQACTEEMASDDSETPMTSCIDLFAGVCCVSRAKDIECMGFDLIEKYRNCFLQYVGCSSGDFACEETNGGGSLTHASVVGLTWALFVPFLSLLWE